MEGQRIARCPEMVTEDSPTGIHQEAALRTVEEIEGGTEETEVEIDHPTEETESEVLDLLTVIDLKEEEEDHVHSTEEEIGKQDRAMEFQVGIRNRATEEDQVRMEVERRIRGKRAIEASVIEKEGRSVAEVEDHTK